VNVRDDIPAQAEARGRTRRPAVWAAAVGLLVFVAVFALVAPASCGTTPDREGKRILKICRSVTGIAYSGATVADFLPAVIFASTAAIPAAFGASSAARRRTAAG
jgi:NADH:ubiquinone oxidoreductase subunit 6 (subunit J)